MASVEAAALVAMAATVVTEATEEPAGPAGTAEPAAMEATGAQRGSAGRVVRVVLRVKEEPRGLEANLAGPANLASPANQYLPGRLLRGQARWVGAGPVLLKTGSGLTSSRVRVRAIIGEADAAGRGVPPEPGYALRDCCRSSEGVS